MVRRTDELNEHEKRLVQACTRYYTDDLVAKAIEDNDPDAFLDYVFPMCMHKLDLHAKSEEEKHMGAWEYIPYPHDTFLKDVKAVIEQHLANKDVNFIDVGCGIGDKLLLAKYFVPGISTVTGIEINTMTIAVGRWLRQRAMSPCATVLQADARDFDYSKYNLIYMYQPADHTDTMTAIYNRVVATMPPNSVMIEVYPHHDALRSIFGDEVQHKIYYANGILTVRKRRRLTYVLDDHGDVVTRWPV